MSLLREAERCIANHTRFLELNSVITPLQSSAAWVQRVRDADVRRENGSAKSPLDGRLIAIKDNICTKSLPTTCASAILDKFTSPFDATVVKALEHAGAIAGPKTNLDEFGMGSHSTNSAFGPVKSNFRGNNGEPLSAGGSSGGSAVAVATEQCYAALGTDTGGSVRLPAAYTGTVGFKPSYGRISRWGVVAYANSLDTVGIISRKTSVARDVFDVLNDHDSRDPTNLSPNSRSRISDLLSQPQFSSRLASRPLRIGVPLEYNIAELTPSLRRAWLSALTSLERQGHSLHPVSLPSTKHALSAYYILAPAEASSNLAKYDGIRYGTRASGPDSEEGVTNGHLYARTRGTGFGAEVQRRILLGSFSLSADSMDNYFIQAQRIRRLVQRDFDSVFAMRNPLGTGAGAGADAAVLADYENDKVDVIIGPTSSSPPPSLASVLNDAEGTFASLDSYVTDALTVPASLAGLPAISVPVPILEDAGSGLNKVGIQIIGQYGDDNLVLRVGEVLEQAEFTD
ncbi:uncharacterized protein TRUGW13939_07296 [Talaromyces rugulosus]|uniref:Glutamyl-tRNA(Gln) amidotransferase subunit A, mitochondrial n=1 Tax=Talaromyces rugulosus TaxID=121627 RepID=A0A7H8R5M3_TALRU|nr:uncharacterized protein TRUGW13939_07296 [Talaromyces rugulosus]QKX60153.1 hypothetical protein TRUGW13939_07296 [Talaromyces rugulosus]